MARYRRFFPALLAMPMASLAQGTCQPPTLGQPCAQGGVATQAQNEPTLNLGAGNPIHLVTGNKYQQEFDLPAGPDAPWLEIVRHYNAMDRRPSVLGQGWSLSYDTRLFYAAGQWQIVQADGSRVVFSSAGGRPRANRHGLLESSGKEWVWTWPSGRTMRFDAHGRLVHIGLRQGSLTIERNAAAGPLSGTITRITGDARNAALSFGYRIARQHAYLSYIDSPQGRFRYEYEPAPALSDPAAMSRALRLQRLIRPDGMQRRYLYEPQYQGGNPLHLTGIELIAADHQHTVRINTWAYDAQGRARLSIRGGPQSSNGKVSLDYIRSPSAQHDGLTVATNALGQKTRFRTALAGGRYVLSQVSGAACPGCAAPGSRADYDEHGRLAAVNGLHIARDPSGAIEQLAPARSGWPGLVLRYQAGSGRRSSWSSALTGTERIQYNPQGQPASRRFANGDTWQYRYDAAGRPIQVLEQNQRQAQRTTLYWRGRQLERVEHPQENESRQYDAAQRLVQRHIERLSIVTGARVRYSETFEYDSENRLIVHRLPEGGMLRYDWGKQGRLAGIDWIDAGGQTHPVIHSAGEQAGYAYGNGVHLSVALVGQRAGRLALQGRDGLIWSERRDYDGQGRLQQEQHTIPPQHHAETWRYAYTAGSRLAGALVLKQSPAGHPAGRLAMASGAAPGATGQAAEKPAGPDAAGTTNAPSRPHIATSSASNASGNSAGRGAASPSNTPAASDTAHASPTPNAPDAIWYAWRPDGALAAQRLQGATFKSAIERDASGLPLSFQGHVLRYGPDRRLAEVWRNGILLDTYRHNAFGQRIGKQSAASRTDYFYLNNQLVAESQAASPVPVPVPQNGRPAITRRYIYAFHVLVGIIDYPLPSIGDRPGGAARSNSASTHHDGGREPGAAILYAVHCDLLGAPRLITDSAQHIRWLATYSPTGAATRLAGDLTLDARLPGQFFDASTGWHDNLLRTYLPRLGQYLEPDPLGPVPANQALGYARQQPRLYIDPTGLLLFAFDGTRNSPQSLTNVWKMSRQYQDGPVFYQAGPGNPLSLDWDAITAYSAPDILAQQWQALLAILAQPAQRGETIPLDIIGFSRGAALARHFGNEINRYVSNGYFSYTDALLGTITACVDLRFMGLFDTVAQFGLIGADNAHYDLSIASAWEWVAHAVALQERRWLFPLTSVDQGAAGNTVEAPFIGSHSDIGGGVSLDENGVDSSRGDLSDVALNWMLWQARAASVRFGTADEAEREITNPILHDLRTSLVRSAQNGDRRVDAANGSLLLNYQDDHERLGRIQRQATEEVIQRIDQWRRSDTTEVGTVDMDGYARWLHDELGWQALPA